MNHFRNKCSKVVTCSRLKHVSIIKYNYIMFLCINILILSYYLTTLTTLTTFTTLTILLFKYRV